MPDCFAPGEKKRRGRSVLTLRAYGRCDQGSSRAGQRTPAWHPSRHVPMRTALLQGRCYRDARLAVPMGRVSRPRRASCGQKGQPSRPTLTQRMRARAKLPGGRRQCAGDGLRAGYERRRWAACGQSVDLMRRMTGECSAAQRGEAAPGQSGWPATMLKTGEPAKRGF